ncbi:hypothetical protein ACIBG8_46425 [Nonomuraea sp. NPDC050556]|uniref:hypothetical protein n=1 Tax=Nonomuraea sp. NPDC050556 TaxID=3364369 RepID=UPI0037AA55C2
MSRADRTTLTLGQRLGQGGQGTVHEVLNRRINGQWDVAFKEYDPGVLGELDVEALTAMTDLIGRLPGWDAAWLCDKTAWPAELVEADGAVTGFLMRAVPYRFSFDLRTLSGTVRKLTTMEFLLNDDAYVGQIGLQVSDRDRLLVLADLADTLARLHAMDIVVGDLSPKNLLFTTGATPECFLIDCDAMRLGGVEALPQVETPDWQIPGDEPKGTPQSDAYKFALLTVRVFARDQSSVELGRLGAISPALADLASAGLYQAPDQRPDPGQWSARLREAASTASTVPATAPPPVPQQGPPPIPQQGPPPGSPPGLPSPAPSSGQALKIGLGVGAGLLGLAFIVAGTVAALPDSSHVAASSTPYTETPTPTPSDTSTYVTPTPTETPTEEPFNVYDLDDKSSDPTPITDDALLPDSFTTAKGVEYKLKASGTNRCPGNYHDANVLSVLRRAKCSNMVTGAYTSSNSTKNSRIMVAVWVVPLKTDGRADTAFKRLEKAYADDWGILCPRKGPGASICDRGGWSSARTIGWTLATHRYLINSMAIYTNLTRDKTADKWLSDASKAAVNAAGPKVYHNLD